MNVKIFGFTTLLTCCSFLSLAQKNNSKGFEIKGHIDGIANGTKVYLYDIDGQSMLDSAISSHGNFTLRGHVEKPTVCWVRCQNETATLQVENKQMKFESPIDKMELNAIIKGGKEQALQNELTLKQYPFKKIYLNAYDSLTNKLFSTDVDEKRLIKIFNEAQTTWQDLYVEFGNRHPNSYLGLDIIYRNRQRIGKDTIKTLISQLSKELKSTSKAQALMIFVNGELAEKGKPFIDFDAKTLNGLPFKLSSLKGNYILLDFWTAGCVPCRLQNKKISHDYNRFKNKISIVKFLTDKNKSDWAQASKSDNILWANVSDLKGQNGKERQYYVEAMPTSFLINKDGIIVDKLTVYDDEIFLNRLEKLIDEK